ncbi:hypothetical protein [Pseudarthrobacter sulfonivorans]|uniref:hypothetical protein n=1 Tax=Pseudarthrobacter sulfonivorans TaxID=121292 RepID=UPI002855E895|nr:hypothetical protein [Pseudarthrobacter sulfonivorans]MDR6416963.1 hypothetical protein [Pseudarthrobacter sulfonivorans]
MRDAEGGEISPEPFRADREESRKQGFQVAASEDVSDDEIGGLAVEVRRAASAVIVP